LAYTAAEELPPDICDILIPNNAVRYKCGNGEIVKALNVYRTAIPSSIAYIGKTIDNIVGYFQEHLGDLDDCQLYELKVILNELIINAVRHGNQEEGGKQVKVAAGITEDNYAFFIVEDQGEGYNYKLLFDKNKCKENVMELCDLMESGRGILIVSRLCDKVRFNHKGNKVVVYKKLCKA
jgi:serine/threonine-protein kinase RsbW